MIDRITKEDITEVLLLAEDLSEEILQLLLAEELIITEAEVLIILEVKELVTEAEHLLVEAEVILEEDIRIRINVIYVENLVILWYTVLLLGKLLKRNREKDCKLKIIQKVLLLTWLLPFILLLMMNQRD